MRDCRAAYLITVLKTQQYELDVSFCYELVGSGNVLDQVKVDHQRTTFFGAHVLSHFLRPTANTLDTEIKRAPFFFRGACENTAFFLQQRVNL